MLPFANMMNFLAYEFARLRRCGLAGALVGTSPPECLFLRHTFPPEMHERNAGATLSEEEAIDLRSDL